MTDRIKKMTERRNELQDTQMPGMRPPDGAMDNLPERHDSEGLGLRKARNASDCYGDLDEGNHQRQETGTYLVEKTWRGRLCSRNSNISFCCCILAWPLWWVVLSI